MKLPPKQKICPVCKKEFELSSDFFHRNVTRCDGFAALCKVCDNVRKNILHRKYRARRDEATSVKREKAKRAAKYHYDKSDYKCSVLTCEAKAQHLHHVDYDKPLDVVPLCEVHHQGIHFPRCNLDAA